MTYQTGRVRRPGHPIHFLDFNYAVYIQQVLQLAGLSKELERGCYESWNPY